MINYLKLLVRKITACIESLIVSAIGGQTGNVCTPGTIDYAFIPNDPPSIGSFAFREMKERAKKNSFLNKYSKGIFIAIGLSAFITTFSIAQGPGVQWTVSKPVGLVPATPSANFQIKINLTAGQYAGINSDGSDLRFYDQTNTNCPYWIELWNTAGTSTIWVKVATSGTSALTMYYGNPAAAPATSGTSTFDYFDDFTTAGLPGWTTATAGGTVTQSGTNAILSNTNGGAVTLSNTSAFTPGSTSFFMETKHREVGYWRNRMYASTAALGSPIGFDYGYFSNATPQAAQTTSRIFYNGYSATIPLANNTDYLTRWQITDGSTYNWFSFNYATGAPLDGVARNGTVAGTIRFFNFQVTEQANTSMSIDWVRVRKFTANEPVATVVFNQTSPQSYNSNSIFVVPAGVTSVSVQIWGGGGGAGGGGTNSRGGGGGGAYSANPSVPVTPGQVITVTVGGGGLAPDPTGGGTNGGNGGTSSFGSLVVAAGGTGGASGGTGGAGGVTGAPSLGTVVKAGGNGGNFATNLGGGSGGQAGCAAAAGTNGTNANAGTGGIGGGQPTNIGTCGSAGAGGNGGNTGQPGSSGTAPGGGGGSKGMGANVVSGNGGNGQVIVTWNACSTTLSSAGGTNAQTICLNAPITNITYAIVGASDATVSGLPTGVTSSFSSGTLTISGTPTAGAGSTFNYTVTPVGACSGTTAAGSIIVRQIPTSTIISQVDITCFGAHDGKITVGASGTTGAYTFSIDNGANYQAATGTDLSLFTGLFPATPYRIKVKDFFGCVSK